MLLPNHEIMQPIRKCGNKNRTDRQPNKMKRRKEIELGFVIKLPNVKCMYR